MNNADHELTLACLQTLKSAVWMVITGMNHWSHPFDGQLPSEINYSALEEDIQPHLTVIHSALEQFPQQSFGAWKAEVLKEFSDIPDDFTAPINWDIWKDRPEGVALICEKALATTYAALHEILLRIGACGWRGILSAWASIRDKLYISEQYLSSAIEQLTMNPMFAAYLRERALNIIHGRPVSNFVASPLDAGESSSPEMGVAPSTGDDRLTAIGNECVPYATEPGLTETIGVIRSAWDQVDGCDDDDWNDDDDTSATGLSAIPVEFRSKPMAKTQAAECFGKVGDAGRRWLNRCIRDKVIKCVRMTRQSYIFDWRQFVKEAQPSVRLGQQREGSEAPLAKGTALPANSDVYGITPK